MDKNIKLHLGSGKRYLAGYLHIDISDHDHIDIKSSVDNLSGIENDTVSEIYASHVFEYFDRNEALLVLNEWKRVLIKGGILRLAVPNAESLFEVYKQTKNIETILGPMYGRWPIGDDRFIYHKTIYDQQSLTTILEIAGFENIELWDWREVFSSNLDYDDHSQAYYPHMDKENGTHISLNIQCSKK